MSQFWFTLSTADQLLICLHQKQSTYKDLWSSTLKVVSGFGLSAGDAYHLMSLHKKGFGYLETSFYYIWRPYWKKIVNVKNCLIIYVTWPNKKIKWQTFYFYCPIHRFLSFLWNKQWYHCREWHMKDYFVLNTHFVWFL